MTRLTHLRLQGFKSIQDLDLAMGPLTLLIGANGSGKSNLVSFFTMLNAMHARPGQLQAFVARSGGAGSLLHHGPKHTRTMTAQLEYVGREEAVRNGYRFTLAHGEGDQLHFESEACWLQRVGFSKPLPHELGTGHLESRLRESVEAGPAKTAPVARFALGFMTKCRHYHFHDTSAEAPIRAKGEGDRSTYLMPRGENLAAFLYRIREERPQAFDRIVRTIQALAPYFEGFLLEPDPYNGRLELRWRALGAPEDFGPHQISDGTLRAMALVTLLLQPPETRPEAIILDEPELGLHPFALGVLWDLLTEASFHTQIILATQSSFLLDLATPEQVVVVEQRQGHSEFRALDAAALSEWRDEFSLSELWEKNVLGGRPTR